MTIRKITLIVMLLCFFSISNISGQWTNISGAMKGRIIALTKSNANLVAGYSGYITDGGFLVSNDQGFSWKKFSIENTFFSFIVYKSHLLGSSNLGIYYSKDDGFTWSSTDLHTYIYSLAQNSNKLFAGSDGAIYASSNGGMNWSRFGSVSGNVFALITSGTRLYAGTSTGVFSSTDDGYDWIRLGLQGHIITCLSASDNHVFAGTDGTGTYSSSDYGKTWTEVKNGLPNIHSWEFISIGSNLFVCSEEGVFLTKDFGENWSNQSTGLNGTVVLSFTTSDSYLYAGTRDNGIWRRALLEMVDSASIKSPLIPDEFRLSQNYPNPFNPTTTIEYQVPKQSNVVLRVMDLLGREIETLVNEEKSMGNYSVKFDGSNYSSGVYFYQLIANGNVITKKFVLMK